MAIVLTKPGGMYSIVMHCTLHKNHIYGGNKMEKRWLGGGGKMLMVGLRDEILFQCKKHSASYTAQDFCMAMSSYFKDRKSGLSAKNIERPKKTARRKGESPASYFFFRDILHEIIRFSRTDAEADALVMVLFEKILETISRPIYAHMEQKGLMSKDISMRGGLR